MTRVAVTGAASGIGAATRRRLEATGHDVLGVDVAPDDVTADLSTGDGRAQAATAILEWCDGTLDGIVACAGISKPAPTELIVPVNYFGTVALLETLRPALAAAVEARAVVVSSNSTTLVPAIPTDLVDACLAGDEVLARSLVDDPTYAYAASKLALARWVRRSAPGPAWAGADIRLNAVAPGATMTPLLQAGLDDPDIGGAIRDLPVPVGGFGEPDDIAAVIDALVGPAGRFVCGSVWFVDGGTDALLRPDDWPATY